MPKLPPAKPGRSGARTEKMSFRLIRQSGSHAVYRHLDGRWTTVPIHPGKDVAEGTLHKIIKDIRITTEEFDSMR